MIAPAAELAPKPKRKASDVSEDERALIFAERHEDTARFDHDRGRWYVWDGSVWRINGDGLALEWSRNICRQGGMRKAAHVRGVEALARIDRRLAVTSDIWDQDPYLLGTPAGTVDLRDGTLRDSDQGDFITRRTAIAPAPDGTEPVVWLAFLEQATKGDRHLIRFLQAMAGYALTGLTTEQSVFFHHGGGGNGKGTFFDAIRGLMGDYAAEAAEDVFASAGPSGHSTDLAMLQGARLVTSSETTKGRAWNEARLKRVTGGDPLTARFMRQDNFTFLPVFKLWVMGNTKPAIRNVDDAIRRRFKLIPWLFKPETVDKELGRKLREEWPAILRWAINGCLDWQAEGLGMPDVVKAETAAYLAEQDSTAQWMMECCEVDHEGTHEAAAGRCLSSKLFGSWAKWCERNGEQAGSNKAFSDDLRSRGFDKRSTRYGVQFLRITLRQPAGTDETLV